MVSEALPDSMDAEVEKLKFHIVDLDHCMLGQFVCLVSCEFTLNNNTQRFRMENFL